MWLHQVSFEKNAHEYISPKLCLTPEIKSKYFRIGECVGIGQTTVGGVKSHPKDRRSDGSNFLTYETEFVLFLAVLEISVLPETGWADMLTRDGKSDVRTLNFRSDVTEKPPRHHEKHRMTFGESPYAT